MIKSLLEKINNRLHDHCLLHYLDYKKRFFKLGIQSLALAVAGFLTLVGSITWQPHFSSFLYIGSLIIALSGSLTFIISLIEYFKVKHTCKKILKNHSNIYSDSNFLKDMYAYQALLPEEIAALLNINMPKDAMVLLYEKITSRTAITHDDVLYIQNVIEETNNSHTDKIQESFEIFKKENNLENLNGTLQQIMEIGIHGKTRSFNSKKVL